MLSTRNKLELKELLLVEGKNLELEDIFYQEIDYGYNVYLHCY